MYKKSSDQLDHIERVGSHATKAHAGGRIDDIPTWAAEPEQYYNSIRDRWKSILDQLLSVQSEIAKINERLRVTLPRNEYLHLTQHKERLVDRFHVLEKEQLEYRPLARAAAEKAWATVFYYLAMKMMSREDFFNIDREVQAVLGRPMKGEISKGQGMMSKTAHDAVVRHRRRQTVRKFYDNADTKLVWADNKPVKQQYADEMKSKK